MYRPRFASLFTNGDHSAVGGMIPSDVEPQTQSRHASMVHAIVIGHRPHMPADVGSMLIMRLKSFASSFLSHMQAYSELTPFLVTPYHANGLLGISGCRQALAPGRTHTSHSLGTNPIVKCGRGSRKRYNPGFTVFPGEVTEVWSGSPSPGTCSHVALVVWSSGRLVIWSSGED